ncbi:MAG TPA: hypothetical protein PK198_08840 [Saprospiraceae bacterium]|nr:hypothetical protein [Saprospiraceae bacterium]
MKRHYFVLVAALVLLMGACRPDDDTSALDQELDEVLQTASNGAGRAFFRMPASDDYAAIPQKSHHQSQSGTGPPALP